MPDVDAPAFGDRDTAAEFAVADLFGLGVAALSVNEGELIVGSVLGLQFPVVVVWRRGGRVCTRRGSWQLGHRCGEFKELAPELFGLPAVHVEADHLPVVGVGCLGSEHDEFHDA